MEKPRSIEESKEEGRAMPRSIQIDGFKDLAS